MLTTIAVLVILMGLMVDLAGYVRNRSANDLAREVLAGLDEAMQQYREKNGTYPGVHQLSADGQLSEDEPVLFRNARLNNQDFVRALNSAGLLKTELVGNLPASIYDGTSLNDAWDMPIVFITDAPGKIGMAPSGRGFFVSAGPDRLYKTREDNLYSYEVAPPTTNPN